MPSVMTLPEFRRATARAMPEADLAYAAGEAVKALSGRPGRIGGYAIRFGVKDVQGEIFADDVDVGLDDLRSVRVVYHHGLGRFGKGRIGTATIQKRPEGIWAEAQLDLATPGGRAAWEEAQAGKLGFSSGSTDRLVVREMKAGGLRIIKTWPLAELSVTQAPVAGLTVTGVAPMKALGPDPYLARRAARAAAPLSPSDRLALQHRVRDALTVPTLPRDSRPVQPRRKEGASVSRINTFDGVGADLKAYDGDFASMAAFLDAVRLRRDGGGQARFREYLDDLKAVGLAGDIGPDGAVLIPPVFAEGIWRQVLQQAYLPIGHVRASTTTTNVHAEAAWSDSSQVAGSRFGGMRAYRIAAEGDALTKSTPRLRLVEHSLFKQVITIAATEELIEDKPNLGDELAAIVAEEFAWVLSDEMIRGTGAGTATGVLNAAALITATAAATGSGVIVEADVRNMFARLPGSSKGKAIWFYHPTIEGQLFDAADAGGLLRFSDPETAGTTPYYATIAGRPAVACELCSASGTVGDVLLADYGQYSLVTKNPAIRNALSLHLTFDKGEGMFKFVLRYDGRPLWQQARTPLNGSTAQSPFVALSASRG